MTHLDGPFRAGEAVPRGLVTRGVLAGPTTTRLFPDVHAPTGSVAGTEDLAARAREAVLYVHGEQPVVGGFAAAELLGASCGPSRSPVDLVVGRRRLRPRDGLRLRQDLLAADDVRMLDDGLRVTSPERTAWDLVRDLPFVEGVVALDALARVGRFAPGDARAVGARRARGADAGPAAAVRVRRRGGFVGRVDLGWEAARVAVEYQGDHHRSDRGQWRRDQARLASLSARRG